MNLPDILWVINGDIGQVRLHGGDVVRIEIGDEIVVVLFLRGLRESVPWQLVAIPCVRKVDVWKAQADGPFRLGERCDKEV